MTQVFDGFDKIVTWAEDLYPAKAGQPWVIFKDDGGVIEPRQPKPHECPHCFRPRHPEPITCRVAEMLASHRLDPDYDPDEDDSPVVCIGSDYQGPSRQTVIDSRGSGFGWDCGYTTYTLAALAKLKENLWAPTEIFADTKQTLNVGSWLPDEEQK